MAKITESKFWYDLLKKILKQILKKQTKSFGGHDTHNQHVVPHDDGWAIKGEGNERHTAIYDHQSDAINRAKDIARNFKSDVIIHRKDGTIRDRITPR